MRSFFVYVMRNPREEHTLVGIYYGPDADEAILAMRQDENVPAHERQGEAKAIPVVR